ESRGSFWLPSVPERRIQGILRYVAGRIDVELLGSFAPLDPDSLIPTPVAEAVMDADVMLGTTDVGRCTLHRVFCRNLARRMFVGAGEDVVESAWVANRLFIGNH